MVFDNNDDYNGIKSIGVKDKFELGTASWVDDTGIVPTHLLYIYAFNVRYLDIFSIQLRLENLF